MASNAAKAAHRGDGGDLRKIQSEQADASENRRSSHQTQLISTVAKNNREQFRISICRFSDGAMKCEIRIFECDREGNWIPTPRRVVIGRGPTAAVIAALCEVEQRL